MFGSTAVRSPDKFFCRTSNSAALPKSVWEELDLSRDRDDLGSLLQFDGRLRDRVNISTANIKSRRFL
ncbi:hypothetical protein E2C01_038500 [Portunus trituberculatus]|uniref:Uncharacterized protein n=1 Tax=Portunus trituberculatus TaxID=210409 RepID=A0A5B7FAZ0_PORTR|nr:hypothetical protein [Portunus trituberculatus]